MRHRPRPRSFQPALVAAGSLLLWLAPLPVEGQCTGCPNPSFGPAATGTRVGFGTFSGAIAADLFGSPDAELVMVTEVSFPSVRVFRRAAAGRLVEATSHQLPTRSQSVVAGDFTGDGIADLIASGDGFSGGLYLLRGTAAETFDPPQDVSPSWVTHQLAAGDFNGDGRLDVASNVQSPGSQVRFFFGNGAGGFSTPASVPAGPNIVSLTAGDFNGDGRSDVATTNQGSNTVSVILGVGAPPFAPAMNFVVGSNPFSAAAADFNSDGKLDLAVSSFQNRLSILLGTGTGGFSPPTHLPTGPGLVAVGDFQADGKTDIAIVPQNFSDPPDLWELSGNGAGSFTTRRHVGWRGSPVAGDFTRDGAEDLAVVSSMSSFSSPVETNLFLIAGSSDGLRAPPATPVNTGFAFPGVIGSADFNGDTLIDVAYSESSGGVRVGIGTGSGTFTPGVLVPSLFNVTDIEAGDLNGDGANDLAVLQASQLIVFSGNGGGQFAAGTAYPVGSNPASISVGELNADGRADLVVTNTGSDSISVLLGTAAGSLQSEGKYAVGSLPTGAALGRLDSDLHLDVVVTTVNGVAVLRGNGAGGFLSIETFPVDAQGGQLRSPLIADFNGDGARDAAFLAGQPFSQLSSLHVLTGDGNGRFAGPATTPLFGSPTTLLAGDFNQDSRPDIFVGGPTAGSVLINSGAAFLEPVAFWIGEPSYAFTVADFVPNGLPDIAVSASMSRAIVVLPNTNCRPVSLVPLNSPGCAAEGRPFSSQPVVEVQDDGGNRITCDNGTVTASILPGTGTPGAVLLGDTTASAAAGLASFTDLGVDRSGAGYRLAFSHPAAGAARSRAFSVVDATFTVPASVCPLSGPHTASVPDAGPGATYIWTISNGQITGGDGTSSVTFRAGPFGQITIEVVIVGEGCTLTLARNVFIQPSGCPPPVGFFTVAPCRLLDTRLPGLFGGPPVPAGGSRTVSVLNRCGLPPTAKALALNVTVTQPSDPGYVAILPGGTPVPPTSTINYVPGQTRANNAIIPVGAAGDLTAFCGQLAGTVDVILDVTGFFE